MQAYKRQYTDAFWTDLMQYTSKAILASTVVILLVTRPQNLSMASFLKGPIMPLYMGVAGGIALS